MRAVNNSIRKLVSRIGIDHRREDARARDTTPEMLGNAAVFESSSRRESRKRRRVSERRRVFSRLGVTGQNRAEPELTGGALSSSADRRRASNMTDAASRPQRSDSLSMGPQASDQGKIAMKIQFHIVIAPDNEPLILDSALPVSSQQFNARKASEGSGQQQQQTTTTTTNKRQISSESSAISEHIQERLSRQNSSTRRRQQLLAMHHQSALDTNCGQRKHSTSGGLHSDGDLTRAGALLGDGGDTSPVISREAGLRSSTITGGMQDEATMNFLARHQQQQQQQRLRQASGSLTSTSSSGLLGQHQTLMASSNNIRQRLEGREHIYFKRDGQRFGHEFTLKLAVDKSYRCLLKVRPLIPVQAISIQGHHVSFVDCSQMSGSSSSSATGGSLTRLNSCAAGAPNQGPNAATAAATTRHQSIGSLLTNGPTTMTNQHHNHQHHHRQRGPSTNTPPICLSGAASGHQQHQNSDPTPARHHHHYQQHDQNSVSLSSLSLGGGQTTRSPPSVGGASSSNPIKQQLQQQLVRQQQQSQMMRHFSGSHGASASSASQLVYMFDWSAGRFEVNKNKARTQVHTVLKFKNGEILSLPLQVKFYEPECRQHLSWGSQLHFIDYDCQINSMGQMIVDRVQYY